MSSASGPELRTRSGLIWFLTLAFLYWSISWQVAKGKVFLNQDIPSGTGSCNDSSGHRVLKFSAGMLQWPHYEPSAKQSDKRKGPCPPASTCPFYNWFDCSRTFPSDDVEILLAFAFATAIPSACLMRTGCWWISRVALTIVCFRRAPNACRCDVKITLDITIAVVVEVVVVGIIVKVILVIVIVEVL